MGEVMNDPMMLIFLVASALSIAGLAWWLTWMFQDVGEEFATVDASFVGPFYLMIPLARKVGKNTPLMKIEAIRDYAEWADKQLAHSGLDAYFTPEEYVGSHVVLFFIGLLFPFSLFVAAPDVDPRYVVMFSIFLAGVFFVFPFYYLNTIIEERKWAIFVGMPYLIDLLTLLVEAGMEFTFAIDRASSLLGKGHLQNEMKRFYKQLQLGASRKKALVELGERVDLMELKSFVTALVQQEELGTPLGKVLRTQAEIMRFRRVQVAEEKANKAPVKILIPMVMFIFPSVFLILMGPMFLNAKAQTGGQ